ncbi:MAG: hypothetical protein BMS9Abin37_0167 [Acidobacteriota bacterium]|nr:MAG: hypothetical protein BMS9Abin37_0167 [Acidobacteriota bacterium]
MTKHREWLMGAILASLWACGSPQQATIKQFFLAAQSDDSATLAAMSAVGAPGPVESWKAVEVSSESTESFTLPGLLVRLEAAAKERDAALEEGREYLADNENALDKIIRKQKQDPEFKFSGELGEIQEEWSKRVEERKATEHEFKELERAINTETSLATKSLIRQTAIEKLDGDVTVTKMLIMLKLEDADEKPYTVTLRKYELSGPGSDRPERSRWIIVDIQEKAPT